ncbi:MAG: GNAT family N-acetyltransferase [Kiritimatiellae bacterium]|jgi:ribosomal protein S18 acetylase RimI-like enzyme|nr:GNAT family N-acetyltransferase [Kiritimatiellia bacterium]
MRFLIVKNVEQLKTIESLARQIWPVVFKNVVSDGQIVYMLDWMYDLNHMQEEIANGTVFELIYEEGSPVGYFAYTEHSDKNAVKLDKVYVVPTFQRRGIGGKVFDYVRECSIKRGYASVILAVNKGNEQAINAYVKAGFKIIESTKNDIGNGFFMNDYVMERKNSAL